MRLTGSYIKTCADGVKVWYHHEHATKQAGLSYIPVIEYILCNMNPCVKRMRDYISKARYPTMIMASLMFNCDCTDYCNMLIIQINILYKS